MKRSLLSVAAALCVLSGCINWDNVQNNCDSTGPCSKFSGAGGGGGGTGDAGGGGGSGDDGGTDAGNNPIVCPGKPPCRGGTCWERPFFPGNGINDLIADDGAVWIVGEQGLIGCFDGQRWSYDFDQTEDAIFDINGSARDVLMGGAGGFVTRFFDGGFHQPDVSGCDPGIITAVWNSPSYRAVSGYNALCEQVGDDQALWDQTGTLSNFTEFAGLTPTDLYAVGRANEVDHRGADGGWETLTNDAGSDYYAACVQPNGDLYVGGSTEFSRLSGGAWSSVPVAPYLQEMACGTDKIWRIPYGNSVQACSSLTSSCPTLPAGFGSMAAVAWGGTGDVVYAGGNNGVVLRWTGGSSPTTLTNGGELPALRAAAAFGDDAWAVGEQCSLLRRGPDGGWTSFPSSCGANYTGIAFEADGGGWLTLSDGRIQQLLPQASGAPSIVDATFSDDAGVIPGTSLSAIAIRGNLAFAVGSGGVVLEKRPDQTWGLAADADAGTDFTSVAIGPDGAAALGGTNGFVGLLLARAIESATLPSPVSGQDVNAVAHPDDANVYLATNGTGEFYSWKPGVSGVTKVNNVPLINGLSICQRGSKLLIGDEAGEFFKVDVTGTPSATRLPTPGGNPIYGLSCTGSRAYGVGYVGAIFSLPNPLP